LPSDEITADMYRLAAERLGRAGYEHYEISNYAQPGDRCRHNQVYWRNQPYYGFGMGATSYVAQQRFSRPRTRREYYQWVEQLRQAGGRIDHPKTSLADQWLETLMMGLRLAEGISLERLQEQFGQTQVECLRSCLAPYQKQGWVEYDSIGQETRVRLTDPNGFLFSNQVLLAIWTEVDEAGFELPS
jgi:coproporphyrinogen III oxidase-like Fe-S oxidoreductase